MLSLFLPPVTLLAVFWAVIGGRENGCRTLYLLQKPSHTRQVLDRFATDDNRNRERTVETISHRNDTVQAVNFKHIFYSSSDTETGRIGQNLEEIQKY